MIELFLKRKILHFMSSSSNSMQLTKIQIGNIWCCKFTYIMLEWMTRTRARVLMFLRCQGMFLRRNYLRKLCANTFKRDFDENVECSTRFYGMGLLMLCISSIFELKSVWDFLFTKAMIIWLSCRRCCFKEIMIAFCFMKFILKQ